MQQKLSENVPVLAFSEVWDTLGPFQIGTREATWGADPLEQVGGFRKLGVTREKAVFKSSLAPGGEVSWSQHRANTGNVSAHSKSAASDSADCQLDVTFLNIDWKRIQSVYGWAALQWQAWSRGKLVVHSESEVPVFLNVKNALEFWVGAEHYFGGDYYAYQRAPTVLHLKPGVHEVNIRLVRDVRLFGATSPPDLAVLMEAVVVSNDLVIDPERSLVPETVEGRLTGNEVSLSLTNASFADVTIDGVKVTALTDGGTLSHSIDTICPPSPFGIAARQSRPFDFSLKDTLHGIEHLEMSITYRDQISPGHERSQAIGCRLTNRAFRDPQRITYFHPSGIVSYALLLPPSLQACTKEQQDQDRPVAIVLHGAGVDVAGDQTRAILARWPELPAWTIVPSGVTGWSGDDWHTWGTRDMEAAIASIPSWIRQTGWAGPGVDQSKWLVIGHSNGGQGVWHLLSTRPDNIIGAAALSAYSSISAYVPYQMWTEADPRQSFCVTTGLRDAKHELFTPNYTNIPIYIQHGDADNNVPVFHSRRMTQLLENGRSASLQYSELEGKDHWFDEVYTTARLVGFYKSVLKGPQSLALPQSFSLVVSNPAEMGSRGGILVEYLKSPASLGTVNVIRKSECWDMKTSNILRFHLVDGPYATIFPTKVNLDGQMFALSGSSARFQSFHHDAGGIWHQNHESTDLNPRRSIRQLGPMSSFLSSNGSFQIQSLSPDADDLALQVSQNLYQYYAADCEILKRNGPVAKTDGNRVTLAVGRIPELDSTSQPVNIQAEYIVIDVERSTPWTIPIEKGMGAIFLSPLSANRLNLIIWGADKPGLEQAHRLVPLLTGVGQPDFVITSSKCAWRGLAGVLAMGLFTNDWKACDAAYLQ